MLPTISQAAITASVNVGANISGGSPAQTETLTVAEGDVVVWAVSTNKKNSAGTIAFSTTSGGAITTLSTASETTNDSNPTSWIGYTTITTAGIYDFTSTATGSATANWVAYVLHSDTAQTIGVIDKAATDNFNLSSGALDFSNTYAWTGSQDAIIIEANGSTNGTLTDPGNLTADKTGGNTTSDRFVGSGTVTGTGFTTNYTLTQTGSGSNMTAKAHSGVVGVAFAAIPEPSTTALLGLGGLALILSRRK